MCVIRRGMKIETFLRATGLTQQILEDYIYKLIRTRKTRFSKIFNESQEASLIKYRIEHPLARLKDLKNFIIQDSSVFSNINSISLPTLHQVLKQYGLVKSASKTLIQLQL